MGISLSFFPINDERIQVAKCGISAEKGVLFGCIINNANRANGRTGMGTVMASKNLKAIAVRGNMRIDTADGEKIREIARHGAENFLQSHLKDLERADSLRKEGKESL